MTDFRELFTGNFVYLESLCQKSVEIQLQEKICYFIFSVPHSNAAGQRFNFNTSKLKKGVE